MKEGKGMHYACIVVTVSIIIIFKRREFGREVKLKFLKSRVYRCLGVIINDVEASGQ